MPDFMVRMYRLACLLPGNFGAGRNPAHFLYLTLWLKLLDLFSLTLPLGGDNR